MTLRLPSSSSDEAQCAIQADAQMSLSWTALLARYSELVHCCTAYVGTDWLLVLLLELEKPLGAELKLEQALDRHFGSTLLL